MATSSPNLNLRRWDSSSDKFNYTELAANFTKIDAHDHTDGKGVQIPTGGIQDGAITSSKLNPNRIGFYGSPGPTTKQTLNAAATDAASTTALTNDIRAKLIALGLFS